MRFPLRVTLVSCSVTAVALCLGAATLASPLLAQRERQRVQEPPKLGVLAGLYPFGAYRRWIAPEWVLYNGPGAMGLGPVSVTTAIELVNPGAEAAEARCIFLTPTGEVAVIGMGTPLTKTVTIPAGRIGSCSLELPEGEWAVGKVDLGGWLAIASNRPVFPRGRTVCASASPLGGAAAQPCDRQIQFYPVDCTDPTGLEGICLGKS